MKSLLLAFLLTSVAAAAQAAPCGLTSVTDGKDLVYPPIAKAAHVTGEVVLLVSFQSDGGVWKALVIRGPQMLAPTALEYVGAWKGNEYGEPRTCSVVISFRLDADQPDSLKRLDPQHVVIYGHDPPCLCDPGADVHRRHWYWPF
jgi:Gram-negative bacterial TonB protein C-terminal